MTAEIKIRHLVSEIARDIIEIDELLLKLNITREEYVRLSNTRAFKEALANAQIEWSAATNTPKRVKLKAAAIVEELILTVFIEARDNKAEPLSAKVKALETIAKVAGIGALEPAANLGGGTLGNTFNLEIHYSNNAAPETITIGSKVIETSYVEESEDKEETGLGDISVVFAEDVPEEL